MRYMKAEKTRAKEGKEDEEEAEEEEVEMRRRKNMKKISHSAVRNIKRALLEVNKRRGLRGM